MKRPLRALRAPTPGEVLDALVMAALFLVGVCAGTHAGGPVAVQEIRVYVRETCSGRT